jgi:hypothetical protein
MPDPNLWRHYEHSFARTTTGDARTTALMCDNIRNAIARFEPSDA